MSDIRRTSQQNQFNYRTPSESPVLVKKYKYVQRQNE